MWDWNPQTNEVHFDERWAEMLGYSYDEIEDTLDTWSSKVHPDDIEQCYADITAHMEGKVDFYENIHRMRHKDGSWLYILDRGKVVERDSEGKPTRFTGTHTNITPQKLAEQQAKTALREKSRFLATMSHEIRTPMNAVLGMNALTMEKTQDPTIKRYSQIVDSSGRTLLNILNDILDFSKIESGNLDLENRAFDIKQSVEDTISLFQELAKEKAISLQFKYQGETHVSGDEHRFKQILNNLLSNALKFTKKGSVTVECINHKNTFILQVQDTGIGIPKSRLDTIFEQFKQADSETTRKFGGTGLGLSIVKLLTQAMGGKITVESEVSKGTVFRASFKFAEAKGVSIVEGSSSESVDIQNLKVLVVDDNSINLELAHAFLDQMKVQSEVSLNILDAIDISLEKRFDVIILDLHMPIIDGFEALSKFQSQLPYRPYFVALTADIFEEVRQRCYRAGFDAFLSKPFTRASIQRELETLFQRTEKKAS
ncbi:PAS domain-containing hybrid sensor histidine kinase/response regulator [Pseudobacteriovorax antillogorgiicola]|uniref:histidine kinase n=1 Tax=Pseudobacteriovorax antillogorgiicola TaxID=1513793 RepID=A0A1Y6CR08_9BACT|nr:PAS domain-containing hybrid sensor histidine kinase/response regulator [Pseudobacteriovorax antillogorgiicola]TCS40838.1 PAS domain S-box-containing protein [Pseudobacteriovorax antillogorgiicola]SMF84289.1 PAS domain S-box-containing protein [Pseudobacteriovorax antillogorgiicola]